MKNFIAIYIFIHHLSVLTLLFNAFCPMLMVSQGFGKSKEIMMYFLRQVTSSNVVIGPQRKCFGTTTLPSTFSCEGYSRIWRQFLSSQFLTSDVQGMGGGWVPASIRLFLNFSNLILLQHLPFSVAVRISLRHILT